MMGAAAGTIVLLLLLSAVLTGAQTAVFQIGSSRVRTLEEEGFSGAEALGEVRANASTIGTSVRLATGALNLGALGLGVTTGAPTWGAGGPVADVLVAIVNESKSIGTNNDTRVDCYAITNLTTGVEHGVREQQALVSDVASGSNITPRIDDGSLAYCYVSFNQRPSSNRNIGAESCTRFDNGRFMHTSRRCNTRE